MNNDKLKGMYVICSTVNSYKLGQIREVLDGAVLIQFDPIDDEPTMPMEMVSFTDLCSSVEHDGIKVWGFFDKAEDMYAFATWLSNPDKPKVLSLVPRKRDRTNETEDE